MSYGIEVEVEGAARPSSFLTMPPEALGRSAIEARYPQCVVAMLCGSGVSAPELAIDVNLVVLLPDRPLHSKQVYFLEGNIIDVHAFEKNEINEEIERRRTRGSGALMRMISESTLLMGDYSVFQQTRDRCRALLQAIPLVRPDPASLSLRLGILATSLLRSRSREEALVHAIEIYRLADINDSGLRGRWGVTGKSLVRELLVSPQASTILRMNEALGAIHGRGGSELFVSRLMEWMSDVNISFSGNLLALVERAARTPGRSNE
ncbi:MULTISPECIES: hypothetical protein [unclassified Rhizobacter]|uniref:hypothetical protein n=1 Tax=unclassified Rhizobacter TaxID=2640088 RepID=UPI000AE5E068|nr:MULTISPECIES: hypothetical protein [unclassified Rhizobacter]